MKFLDFERPLADLEGKIEELRHLSNGNDMNITEEILKLQGKADKLLKTIYATLTPWQTVQVARHQNRPQFFDYLKHLITDFVELAGDRLYANDHALVGGLGRFRGIPVMVMGHQKGRDTESRLKHSFGMPKPEGYRKAQRLMQMAERFHLPILSFVDTAGAFAGIEAEERGQAEAIAKSIEVCLKVQTPFVSVVIGEGGSGGAIAIAAGDHVLMLEHSVYSVISPEACSAILWRSVKNAQDAAAALRLTSGELHKLGIIDTIIPEGLGGAHRNTSSIFKNVENAIENALKPLKKMEGKALLQKRRQKFLNMGGLGL